MHGRRGFHPERGLAVSQHARRSSVPAFAALVVILPAHWVAFLCQGCGAGRVGAGA
jgi:hypothetical protein